MFDSAVIRENGGQRKPVYWYILRRVAVLRYTFQLFKNFPAWS